MSTIIWDFDNTLFQTKRFWRENLFPAFQHLGIGADAAEAGFKAATGGQDGNPDYFVPRVVAQQIHKRSQVNEGEILSVIEGVTYSDLGQTFFFPYALQSVDIANENGCHNLLLSYGDSEFKQRWFESIGIFKHFDTLDVHVTAKKKGEMVQSLPLKSHVAIVNDVLIETKRVMDVLDKAGHTVSGFQFVADPEKLKDEPQENRITNFSSFKDLHIAL